MSKYRVGDKFVIEIAEKLHGGGDQAPVTTLFRIHGFNSLVFDKKGLDKLERLKDPRDISADAYEEGYNEGYHLGFLKGREDTYKELTELKEREELDKYIQKELIQPNDEVQIDFPTGSIRAVITGVHEDSDIITYMDCNGNSDYLDMNKYGDIVHKTGRHFDIEGILEGLK